MAGKMVILGSCIVIEPQKGNQEVIDKVYEFEQQDIFVTPVVIAGFYRGARDKIEFAKCHKLISKLGILSLNEGVANTFSDIFDHFSLSHRPSIPDVHIASTALHYDIPLFTLNKKDFQFLPNIRLVSI